MSLPRSSKPHGYGRVAHHGLRRLFQHPSCAFISHWLFQSIFYMHRTERFFKLSLDLLLTLSIGIGLNQVRSHWSTWVIAWTVAHTINFCCNGHVWGVLKHFYPTGQTALTFDHYREQLLTRITHQSCITDSVVIGSSATHLWTPYSDLDIRLMRSSGSIHGIRACWFAVKERTRAFIHRFPLDLYILDPIQQSYNEHE